MKPFVSLFSRSFDAVVYGTGMVGLGAVRRLVAEGAQLLWLNPGADLLWEVTRAFETTASEGGEPWRQWLDEMGQGSGPLDPVAVEARVAAWLLRGEVSVLFGAVPISAQVAAGRLQEVAVATRAGVRTVRAARWVDVSERGTLVQCVAPGITRSPHTRWWSLLAHAQDPEALARAAAGAALPTCHASLLRLRWAAGEGACWRLLAEKVRTLRAGLPHGWSIMPGGDRAFPLYEAGGGGGWPGGVENLVVASPALRAEPIGTLAERFHLGWRLEPAPQASGPASPALLRECEAEVAVVGGGTAGAVAAIAAARQGAQTMLFDAADAPGGIGTLGGITGYFHGAPGGLQEEIDARVGEWGRLLTGDEPKVNRWHAEARKWALYEFFEAAGVRFAPGMLLYEVEEGASAIRLAGEQGGLRVQAAVWVDATGDADLCALAGARFTHGREGDNRALSYSQPAYTVREGYGCRAWNFDAGWVDATDSEDLTRARLEGVARYTAFQCPPEELVVALAPMLGVRQSRQILTDYVVSLGDLVEGRRFDDSIGLVETVADSHSVDFEFESDDATFYFWCCRGFRHRLRAELPYRMLLPQGLRNVWVACRGAGISVDAAYGLRMQREMQRLGEAAGVAAALAARAGGEGVDYPLLRAKLEESGALRPLEAAAPPPLEELFTALDAGVPGVWLWHLCRAMEAEPECRSAVMSRLASAEAGPSFCAAVVCAMAGEAAAQPRLLAALERRERGIDPAERPVPGAFGQLIDVPWWLQAVFLLRRVGTEAALPLLRGVLETPHPFNVRTAVGLTLLALARRLGATPGLVAVADAAAALPLEEASLPPSRSLWRQLHGQPQKPLANERGMDNRQSHAWQWRLILARLFAELHLPQPPTAMGIGEDARGFVRRTACVGRTD